MFQALSTPLDHHNNNNNNNNNNNTNNITDLLTNKKQPKTANNIKSTHNNTTNPTNNSIPNTATTTHINNYFNSSTSLKPNSASHFQHIAMMNNMQYKNVKQKPLPQYGQELGLGMGLDHTLEQLQPTPAQSLQPAQPTPSFKDLVAQRRRYDTFQQQSTVAAVVVAAAGPGVGTGGNIVPSLSVPTPSGSSGNFSSFSSSSSSSSYNQNQPEESASNFACKRLALTIPSQYHYPTCSSQITADEDDIQSTLKPIPLYLRYDKTTNLPSSSSVSATIHLQLDEERQFRSMLREYSVYDMDHDPTSNRRDSFRQAELRLRVSDMSSAITTRPNLYILHAISASTFNNVCTATMRTKECDGLYSISVALLYLQRIMWQYLRENVTTKPIIHIGREQRSEDPTSVENKNFIFLACVVIAIKYIDDFSLDNQYMATFFKIPVKTLNEWEIAVLQLLEFKLGFELLEAWQMRTQLVKSYIFPITPIQHYNM